MNNSLTVEAEPNYVASFIGIKIQNFLQGKIMDKKQAADLFIEYMNNLSNILDCGENISHIAEETGISNEDEKTIWGLSSKKISFEQFMLSLNNVVNKLGI